MTTDAKTAREATARLVLASKEFLDAFVGWEAATHLDFGGGIESSEPTLQLRNQVQELLEGVKSMRPLNDELRDLLHQVTHRLATRGFVGRKDEVG